MDSASPDNARTARQASAAAGATTFTVVSRMAEFAPTVGIHARLERAHRRGAGHPSVSGDGHTP